MSDRRGKSRKQSRTIAYISAVLIHVVIIGTILVNFGTKQYEVVEAFDADKVDVVKATTISEDEIRKQENQLKKQEQDKKRKQEQEKQRLDALKRKAEKEKQQIAKLEQERKKIALQKKKEQEAEKKRQKELAERKRKEELERKKREKALAEKKRKDELERIQREQQEFEAQQRLNQLLAEEERLRAQQDAERRARERTTTLISRYSSRIKVAINSVRTIPPGTERWRKTKVNIKLSSQGEVIDINILESSGSTVYDRSVETAIRQASPLPIATEAEDPQAHLQLRDITLNFSVTG